MSTTKKTFMVNGKEVELYNATAFFKERGFHDVFNLCVRAKVADPQKQITGSGKNRITWLSEDSMIRINARLFMAHERKNRIKPNTVTSMVKFANKYDLSVIKMLAAMQKGGMLTNDNMLTPKGLQYFVCSNNSPVSTANLLIKNDKAFDMISELYSAVSE